MGWLRELMSQAEPAVPGYGELARRSLDEAAPEKVLQRGEVLPCFSEVELTQMRLALQQIAIRDELLRLLRGRPNGVWHDPNVCSHYATAMACIILQIPNNYLPILQK